MNSSFQPLLACKFSFEKSSDSLMGIPLQVTLYFSLAAFKIFIKEGTFSFSLRKELKNEAACIDHSFEVSYRKPRGDQSSNTYKAV